MIGLIGFILLGSFSCNGAAQFIKFASEPKGLKYMVWSANKYNICIQI